MIAMKTIGVFVILFFNLLGVYAQQINRYNDETGREIVITDSLFYYIEKHPSYPYWYNDTLAICTIKKLSNEFWELNSQDPYQTKTSGYKVLKKTVDNISDDSLEISFLIPYDRGKLIVSIMPTNIFPVKNYDFFYSQSNNSIIIPQKINCFTYSIMPDEGNAIIHDVRGMNYGILFMSSESIFMESDINHIEISIPSLTNSFFEKYYVKGEYARIVGDTIIWKGRKFKRK